MGVCDEKILRKARSTPKNRKNLYGNSISSKSRDFISETDKNSIFTKNIPYNQSKDNTNSSNNSPDFKNSHYSQRNIFPKFEDKDKNNNQIEKNKSKEMLFYFSDTKNNNFLSNNLYYKNNCRPKKIFEDTDNKFNSKKGVPNKYLKRNSNSTNIKLIRNKEQEPIKLIIISLMKIISID